MGKTVEAKIYKNVVETHPSQGDIREIEGSEAVLVTAPPGAFASLETSELTPGHAYTLWFVAINKPEAYGTGTFTTHRPKGAIPQAWIGTGLTEPETAEIHLVVHDHGPLIAGREAEMTGTFRGGCTEESLSEMAPDTARADGEPGPNACKLVQDVIFMQDGVATQ